MSGHPGDTDDLFLGLTRETRRAIVGGAAVVYGLAIAVSEDLRESLVLPGAVALGLLWLVLMVIPWFARRAR